MCFILIVASPRINLSETFVGDIANHWQISNLRWLDQNKAAEYSVPSLPMDFEEVRRQAHLRQIDLVVLPDKNRRKRLLIADMDSTFIEQECIDQLADAAGLGDQVAEITERAMNGEISFSYALRQRVALLKGLDAHQIDEVWTKRISFTPGGKTLVSTMRANGGEAVLVSGGFTAFTALVANAIGFNQHYANELLIENGKITGFVRQPTLGREAKLQILQELMDDRKLASNDVVAVGDGANDIDMLQHAGLGVAFRAKTAVNEQIRVQIRHGDLTALLFLQGYRREEFVY